MSSRKEEYSDIFDLPHHVSTKRAPMSRASRAAQFSPFAALTGYDSLVAESARATDQRKELTDDEIEALNMKINFLQSRLNERPIVRILHFMDDGKKAGGSYIETEGIIRKIHSHERIIVLESGTEILLDDVIDLSSTIFHNLDFSEGDVELNG